MHKKGRPPKKLKTREYLYRVVEDTNVVKQPPIQLLLTENVEKFGRKGDIVSVNPYTAYEKLILPGLAAYATPENIKHYSDIISTGPGFSSKYAKRVSIT